MDDKASKSEIITAAPDVQAAKIELPATLDTVETISEVSVRHEGPNNYLTDTSEVDDLFDSSGAEIASNRPYSSVPESEVLPSYVESLLPEPGHQMEELSDPCLPSSSALRQLSATGRSVLPKCFSEKVSISLSMDQPTIAFSESQIHQILRTISDETVLWETRDCSRLPVRRGSRTRGGLLSVPAGPMVRAGLMGTQL